MEVTYRKNLSKSYMCIQEQGKPVEKYELQMIEGRSIPGILPMQSVISEGKRSYLYDISGKQQIEDYLSGKKMDYAMLRVFLIAIQQVCLSLSEYLLREEGICLEIGLIYVNLEDGSLQFTYLPCYEKNLPDAFQFCMEQMLRKIDHQDLAAVDLGYQVYQLCVKENADIGSILTVALGARVNVEEEIAESKGSIQQGKKENKKYMDAIREKGKNNGNSQNAQEEIVVHGAKAGACASSGGYAGGQDGTRRQIAGEIGRYFPAFSLIWANMQAHLHAKQQTKKQKALESEKKQKEKRAFVTWGNVHKKKVHKKKEKQQCPEEEQIISFSADADIPLQPTEILSARQEGAMGRLAYRGIHQCEDFQIKGESFLLGKNSEQADGVISAEGVSRLHARISRKEHKFYIEDLNSTNGTYLNDIALAYHQPQELKANDRVRFAGEEYVFF